MIAHRRLLLRAAHRARHLLRAWQEPLALQLEGLNDVGCFERHQQVRVRPASYTGTEGVTYEGPHIMLDAVTYRTLGRSEAGRVVILHDVAYLGVIERPSDGFTVLSVLKPGASRAFSIEMGALLSVSAHGRVWHPKTHERRWRLRAAELRAFVEETELEAWARPYFDPVGDKHHRKQPVSKVARRSHEPRACYEPLMRLCVSEDELGSRRLPIRRQR